MKTKQIFAGLLILSSSFLARAQVEQVAVDSGKEVLQGATSDNGRATITQAGKVLTVTTKTLLEDLALDETLAGKWFAKFPNKIPANAKLEVIYPGRGEFGGLSYRVVSGTNIVDVSNVLTASAATTGTNVQAETLVDTNGFEQGPFSFTVYQNFTITYDARPVGGHLWFQVTGMATCSARAGNTNPKNGKFVETDSFNLIDGTGAGVDSEGTAFVISGVAITASGSGTQTAVKIGAPAGTPGQPGWWESSIGDGDVQVSAPIPPSIPTVPAHP